MSNVYFSENYDKPVSMAFLTNEEYRKLQEAFLSKEEYKKVQEKRTNAKVSVKVSECTIDITPEHLFYLYLGSKRLRKLSFPEFLEYRKHVKNREELYLL